MLHDFHDARLVDRRGLNRHSDLPIEALSHVQARALEDVLKAIETMSAGLGLEDTPRDIVITTRREFQILRFLEGELTEDQAWDATITGTRKFARRQDSWFRRDERIAWFDARRDDLVEAVVEAVAERSRTAEASQT